MRFWVPTNIFFNFLFYFLILERGEVGEREEERNIDARGKHPSVASCMCLRPDQGTELQLRNVAGPGVTLATFWSAGQCSAN